MKRNLKGRKDYKPHIGKSYGRLTVVSVFRVRGKRNYLARFKCVCSCGRKNSLPVHRLLSGSSKSCGCLNIESLSKRRNKERNPYLPRGMAATNWVYRVYKRNAASRDLAFEISIDKFIEIASKNCAYCGVPPREYIPNKNITTPCTLNGIDRKNNSIGYTARNIAPCCWTCNRMKWDLGSKYFKEHTKRIAAHLLKSK